MAALAGIGAILLGWLFLFFNRGFGAAIPAPPYETVAAFVELCGLLFAESPNVAFIAGLCVLLAFFWLAATGWFNAKQPQQVLIVTGIFALGALAMIAYGRARYGVIVQLRYRTFTALLTAVTMALAFSRLEQLSVRYRYTGKAILFIAAGWSFAIGAKQASDFSWMMQTRAATVIDTIMNHKLRSREQISFTFPFSLDYAPPLMEFLDRRSLNVFSQRDFYSRFAAAYAATVRENVQRWESAGATYSRIGEGLELMRGSAHIFSRFDCPEARVCTVTINVNIVSASQSSAIGIIFRDKSGRELQNTSTSISGTSDGYAAHIATGPRQSVSFDAYIYSPSADGEVRFKDFSVTVPTVAASAEVGCRRVFCLPDSFVQY
jgi:hypothetical protein